MRLKDGEKKILHDIQFHNMPDKKEEQLRPIVVANTTHRDLHIPEPPQGHVTLARLGDKGEELDYFIVNERTYQRTYSDPKKYAKKKPVK